MTSCHCAIQTREGLQIKKFRLPKEGNPPNVPRARSVEEFCALLSIEVYDNGREIVNEEQTYPIVEVN